MRNRRNVRTDRETDTGGCFQRPDRWERKCLIKMYRQTRKEIGDGKNRKKNPNCSSYKGNRLPFFGGPVSFSEITLK